MELIADLSPKEIQMDSLLMEEAVSEEYKKELRSEMQKYKKQKDEEILKKEKDALQSSQRILPK